MKYREVLELEKNYGSETTLKEVSEHLKKIAKANFKCPKCDGKGEIEVEYNAYPTNLPDSGWVEDMRIKKIECDLCNGEGFTETLKKPKMVQVGWFN